jgi:DNA polymerase delta subunit OB-fold domain
VEQQIIRRISVMTAQYDELMAVPDGEDASISVNTALRATATYKSLDDQFKLQDKNFDRQYAQLYYFRLMKLRPVVLQAAKSKWPTVPVVNILNLPEDESEVAVAGTMYKEMALKPSILDEYDKDRVLKHQLGTAALDYCIQYQCAWPRQLTRHCLLPPAQGAPTSHNQTTVWCWKTRARG